MMIPALQESCQFKCAGPHKTTMMSFRSPDNAHLDISTCELLPRCAVAEMIRFGAHQRERTAECREPGSGDVFEVVMLHDVPRANDAELFDSDGTYLVVRRVI